MHVAWSFKTARFTVSLEIEPERDDPHDHFEFQEDIEAVLSGKWEWFCASVVVRLDGREVGRDSLGACAYEKIADFYTAHRDKFPGNRNTMANKARGIVICHYFPDMVRNAVSEARATLANIPRLRA